MTEVFTLSWDDFNNKCPKAFKELWLDTDLSDVTLATEDGAQLNAHKVILAACSPLFKRLFQKNPNGHPLLYLMGVQLSQLQQLLSYIYLGQCDLTQDQLPAFMATGKQLEVEGLLGDMEERSADQFGGNLKSHVQEEKFPALIRDDIPLKEEELEENIDHGKKHQETREDEIDEVVSLNDNANATFQDNIGMLNNDKSIIGTQLDNLQKEIQCPFCEYRPVNSSNIKHHVANVHQGLKYDCTNCDYQSGDKSNLRRHIEKSHLGVTYTCAFCKHVCSSKQLLKSHVDVKHNGLLFKCDNCQFNSARKSNLENHILVQHNGVAFDCSIWQHKNNRKQGLVNHIKKTHEGLRYECHECDGVFTGKQGVKRHVKNLHKGLK